MKEDNSASQISVDEISIHSAEDNPESILVDSDISKSSGRLINGANSGSDADLSDTDS